MSKTVITVMALWAAMPVTAQIKARGVPLRAKVDVTAAQTTPTLDAAALGRIAAATEPAGDLQRPERALFTRVSERLRHKDRAAAMENWERAIRMMRERGAAPDADALVNWVLREAYLEGSKDLKMYADKVRFFNDQKEAAYASKAELERTQEALRRGNARRATTRPVTLAASYRPGARAVTTGRPKPATVESVVEDLQKIVVLCNRADENAQTANIDLQNALQKQQQTLQTMSNVSKAMHETMKAIINNMKA